MDLQLSLVQKQTLSIRMQLSVKILQMNTMELMQHVWNVALENPLIEIEERQPEEQVDEGLANRLKKLEWLDQGDESNPYFRVSQESADKPADMPLYEKKATDGLEDILLQQLPGFKLDAGMEAAVRYIIGNLDENGYLALSRAQLRTEVQMEEQMFEEALGILHSMDPAGVGVEDIRECLMVQAERAEASSVVKQIIAEHLELLAKNQLAKLARVLHVPLDTVKQAREQISVFNPKPGNGYASQKLVPYIYPDIYIMKAGGAYQVVLNDDSQPRIFINSYYRELAGEGAPEVAEYINDKLNKAEWLISCINQRKRTVLRCANSILARQRLFFDLGPGHLSPMTHADIADDLGLHPSTISRTVNGKYLQCAWGVFALADFFSHNVSKSAGGLSQDMVMNQIKSIISQEDSVKPYSDQEIAARLQRLGVNIARRTVAKYREQLGFPSASGRRKY